MIIDTHALAETTETRGEDASDIMFLAQFYRTPKMHEKIGGPLGCRNIATLEKAVYAGISFKHKVLLKTVRKIK